MAYCCAGSPGGMLAHSLHFSVLANSTCLAEPAVLHKAYPIHNPASVFDCFSLFFSATVSSDKKYPRTAAWYSRFSSLPLYQISPKQKNEFNSLQKILLVLPLSRWHISNKKNKKLYLVYLQEPNASSKAVLAQPDPATNPGQLDFQHYLRQQGIFYEIELQNLGIFLYWNITIRSVVKGTNCVFA